MKSSKYFIFLILILSNLFCLKSFGFDQFNFNVTEIEIQENGNLIKGLKRGVITTDEGIIIEADQFEYEKSSNILNASGNVKVTDKIKDYEILSEEITYFKNLEKIITKKKSKVIYEKNKIIEADQFQYEQSSNILNASGNVKLTDKIKDYEISSEEITYFKNTDNIITKGKTNFLIKKKYDIKSKDVFYSANDKLVSSNYKTKIRNNNSNFYELDKFNFKIDDEILKGENIVIITNYNLPKSDKFYLSSAIINLKKEKIIAKDTEVKIHKNIFNNNENDPRLKGVSSYSDRNTTIINKGIFTSCKKTDDCPPWSIQAEKITHDKNKKQLNYKSAIIKVYDIPILYFPKFFHPDPTIERQSGFLKPQLNNSNILGNSVKIPYYKTLGENKDITITPTLFDDNFFMLENEYRQINENSNLEVNLGIVNGYKSSTDSKKKNINNFFAEFNQNLNLEDFISSDLYLSLQSINNDTFLKIFDQNIQDTKLKPKDPNILESHAKISLNHSKYNLNGGFAVYENLEKVSSDRYQYILPYFNFDKKLSSNFLNGFINFSSSGENNLTDTNKLETSLINDLEYIGANFLTNSGFENNFEVNIKNLNTTGKNSSQYKSSPQVELMTLYSFNSSYPLIKEEENYQNYLIPKLSLKINPHDMKNYSSTKKNINTTNIFDNNRLGLSDSFETGESLTLGLNYKREDKNNFNNFLHINLATVLRLNEEEFIPSNTTINKKNSNIFGNIKTSFNELLDINYNFAIDNNYNKFEFNEFDGLFKFGKINTEINFLKESNSMGGESFIGNNTSYIIDDNNSISFSARRNRKIDLTEYYNLVYEYKNDCLTAGIKYNKTFYEDRDLKPSENLFFSITLIPIGEYEQKINN